MDSSAGETEKRICLKAEVCRTLFLKMKAWQYICLIYALLVPGPIYRLQLYYRCISRRIRW